MRQILIERPARAAPSPANRMAAAVRDIYCQCYRQATGNASYGESRMPEWDGSDGSDHRFGKRTKAVWPKIADAVARLGADPLGYIQAQFNTATGRQIPRPNQLYGPVAAAAWKKYLDVAEERARREITAEDNQIRVLASPLVQKLGWAPARALTYALADTRCDASPLLKLCVAHEHGVRLPEAVREAAVVQYIFQAGLYDRLLGSRIPQDLKATAAACRPGLVS